MLPQSRSTTSGANGDYLLAPLPPGSYEVTYSLDGMSTKTATVEVLLEQTSRTDIKLRPEGVSETVQVVGTAPLIDLTSSEIKAAIVLRSTALSAARNLRRRNRHRLINASKSLVRQIGPAPSCPFRG